MKTRFGMLVLSTALAGVFVGFTLGCSQSTDATGAPPTSTTIGTEIDDSVVSAQVKSALLADPDIKGFDFKIATRKGEVQLSGFVDNQSQIERALVVTQAVQGVKSIDNKVSLKGAASTLGNKVDDSIVTTQVKAALLEIQLIAMDLRPAILDDIGLIATLTWFFREYRTLHPDLALLSEIGLEEAEVARSLRSHIFRIVQEALNNVIKHAHASEVLVRLWRTKRELHLEVADNGSGFEFRHDELALTDGYALGLSGMRDRAEITGGCFRIVSVPGKGTRICVVWPLLLP